MWQLLAEHPVAGVIGACEIGLWVFLALGLLARYLLRLRRTSTVILALIPALDVVLVAATAIDLHNGAKVDMTHGLAAIYLGSSLAFGPALVRWADARFAHWFAGEPAPRKAPKHGPERRRHLWREWYRVVNAATIASAVLLGLIVFVADSSQDGALAWWIGRVWVVVGLWYLFGPLWESGARDREDREDTEKPSVPAKI